MLNKEQIINLLLQCQQGTSADPQRSFFLILIALDVIVLTNNLFMTRKPLVTFTTTQLYCRIHVVYNSHTNTVNCYRAVNLKIFPSLRFAFFFSVF
jgi:hypothetical protein